MFFNNKSYDMGLVPKVLLIVNIFSLIIVVVELGMSTNNLETVFSKGRKMFIECGLV